MARAVITNLQYHIATHEDGSFTLIYGDGLKDIDVEVEGDVITLTHPYEEDPCNYVGPKEFTDLGEALMAVEELVTWLAQV